MKPVATGSDGTGIEYKTVIHFKGLFLKLHQTIHLYLIDFAYMN